MVAGTRKTNPASVADSGTAQWQDSSLDPEAIQLGEDRDAKFHLTYGVERKVHGSNDSWIDDVLALVEPYESNLYDRCISRGVIGSILPGEPGGYNLGNQIMQAPGLVVIRYEMIHETRVIPVNRQPESPARAFAPIWAIP